MAPTLTIDPDTLNGSASSERPGALEVGDLRTCNTAPAECGLPATLYANAAPAPAAKNPKPKKRLYPLQRPHEFTGPPPGRNAPCVCGSGQKFKRCCGA